MRARRQFIPTIVILLAACSTSHATSLGAEAPPHYAGPVMSIAEPVQFICAPNPTPWRIRSVETEQGSDGQPTVTALSGTVTGSRSADKIVLNFDLNTSPPSSPILLRFERLPTGEITDMSIAADGKITSLKDAPELASIMRAVFAAAATKPKEGGYRQGDIVGKVEGRDLFPSLKSIDFDGQMITTLDGATICSRSCRQATSMGRTIGATSARSASRASTRRSNGRPRIAPGSMPKVLSTPRIWFDNRVVMPTSWARAPSRARARWASNDLTCTDRYHPVRMICASPSASF
jgi:hypothetical protein